MMSTTQYSISTRNRFQLCDFDDEDPLELLASREKEMESKKKTKLAEKENKVKEPPVKAKPKKEGLKKEVKSSERKFTGENRDDKVNINRNEERKNDRNKEERSYDKDFSTGENGVESRRGRGGRGGSNFRGGRGGGGRGGTRPNYEGKPPKREFDRHSGSNKTGVKPVERKENAPSRISEDFEETPFEQTAEDWTEQPPPEEKAKEKTGEKDENDETPAQVEEARELTLDEWKALKKPKQAPSYNIRKAGEGEDPSQWKKMYALKKNKKSDSEEEYEFDNSEYPQRVGRRQKHVLDIDIRFKDTRAPAVRGGRGFRRGAKSQFQGTPASHNNSLPKIAPKVDDEHDFPSLN